MGHWKDVFCSGKIPQEFLGTVLFLERVIGRIYSTLFLFSFYFSITTNSFLPGIIVHYTLCIPVRWVYFEPDGQQTCIMPPCTLDSLANFSQMQNRQKVQLLGNTDFLPLTWRQYINIQEMYNLATGCMSECNVTL